MSPSQYCTNNQERGLGKRVRYCNLITIVSTLLICCATLSNGNIKGKPIGKTSTEQIEEGTTPHQFKEAVFIYPPGIRSERDIPVCTKWIAKRPPSEDADANPPHDPNDNDNDWVPTGPKVAASLSNSLFSQQNGTTISDILVDAGSVLHGDPGKLDDTVPWESVCNIVHRRFFYPPVVERLCRCPDRTECPWEWSQPPPYPNSPVDPPPDTPKGTRDPYTIMLSSRSQAKFCTEVNTGLPRCPNPKTKKGNDVLSANLVKTVHRRVGGEEVPKIAVNCFCPPLYRQWKYIGNTEPVDFGNGTINTNHYYRCERLSRCRRDDRCGNIRTDLHFSFYHCTCPQKHLCMPKVYPPESVEDVEEDVHEVLFKGQVSPAYCTPYPFIDEH